MEKIMSAKRTSNKIMQICFAGLLSAIGIVIPMIAPRIVIEPASFTLASHVAIFIAMFISPGMAAAVALISALGFFISGFPLVVVIRALTHVLFALVGAYVLKRHNNLLLSPKTMVPFALLISLLHAAAEVAAVSQYYYATGVSMGMYYIFVLVGIGTVIHSMIDFMIAVLVWHPLQGVVTIPVNARVGKVLGERKPTV